LIQIFFILQLCICEADGTAVPAKSIKNEQKKIKIKVKTGKIFSVFYSQNEAKRNYYLIRWRKILATKRMEFLTKSKKKETKLNCEMLWSIKIMLKRCQNPRK
jgi:hypothetical protein